MICVSLGDLSNFGKLLILEDSKLLLHDLLGYVCILCGYAKDLHRKVKYQVGFK